MISMESPHQGDSNVCIQYAIFINMPPNFEEVEGAYWFGPVRPSVRLSVSPSVRNSLTAEKL